MLVPKQRKQEGTWRVNIPQPRIPAIEIAPTIAQGTAVAALEASSEMWTLESNEPYSQCGLSFVRHGRLKKHLQIVHKGARKLRMKA